jgi:hypothetical protein
VCIIAAFPSFRQLEKEGHDHAGAIHTLMQFTLPLLAISVPQVLTPA